jgi:uncharacterized protein YcbK (DUF882 family)
MRPLSRRTFVATLAGALPALMAARVHGHMATPVHGHAVGSRALTFNHLHTGERLTVEYFNAGQYVPDALTAVDHLLRDFRTGEQHAIDLQLLDLLHELVGVTGSRQPFEVISGYRSPATNQALRKRSEGVAAGSLHMQGQAVDIRVADVRLGSLRDAARAMRRGGVGYYPASDFVHVDTGRVRTW